MEHYSGIWYSLFSHSIFPSFRLSPVRSCTLTLSKRFTCLARNSLPFTLLFFFTNAFVFLGRPRGISGSPTRSRLITLSDRCGLFPRIEADELIFSVINFDPVNHSADTWNIFRTAIDSASRFYLVICNIYQFSAESWMSYYCTLSVNRSLSVQGDPTFNENSYWQRNLRKLKSKLKSPGGNANLHRGHALP